MLLIHRKSGKFDEKGFSYPFIMMYRLKTSTFVLMLLLSLVSKQVMAQSAKPVKQSQNGNTGLGLGINIPAGSFSSTHVAGISAEYAPVRHVLGLIKQKKWAFTYNGGIAYYFGKKETVSGYRYKYPNYTFIHAFAGVLYQPCKKTALSLTAGPALGIYNGNTRFNTGSKLEATYFINPKLAIGPGLILMKESGADALWSAGLKTTFVLQP